MSHTGGQQADGGKFVGLHQARFKLGAFGHIVENNEAPDAISVPGNQGSYRNIEHGRRRNFACGHLEFVDVVDACFVTNRIQVVHQFGGKQFAQPPANGSFASNPGGFLQLIVPTLDAIFKVRRKDSDVNRFDDILAEFLQPLIFIRLALQTAIKPRIFYSDAHVAG